MLATQLLKDLFDLAIFPLIQEIESQILVPYANIVEYRSHVKSIGRGSTLFLQKVVKSVNFEDDVKRNIALGSNFFVLIHECLHFWAKFIPSDKRHFRQVYEKLARYCTFPVEWKYFKQSSVESFHRRLKEEEDSIEYEVEEIVRSWEALLAKMASTHQDDQDARKLIRNASIDCEEFALNYHDRLEEVQES